MLRAKGTRDDDFNYSATITHKRRGIYLVEVAEHRDGNTAADAYSNLADAKRWAEEWCEGRLRWRKLGSAYWMGERA